MTGYYRTKMSNNAVLAYSEGKKPLSRWSKSEIVDNIIRTAKEKKINIDNELLGKVCSEELKDTFLMYSEYHHTSKYFNTTSFYEFAECMVNPDIDSVLQRLVDEHQKKPKKQTKPIKKLVYAKASWTVFEGARNHPNIVNKEGYCIINGNWAYFGFGKKSVNGKHFQVIQTYTKAPYGKGNIYKEIQKKWKL